MTTNAIPGVGTTFGRGDGASNEAFTNMAEVNSVNFTGLSQDTIDVTSLDSLGGYREFITGFKDSGEMTLNLNFTAVNFALMKTDFEAVVARNYKVTLPDTGASTLDFAGLCNGLSIPIETDGKISLDVTFKISGAITFAS